MDWRPYHNYSSITLVFPIHKFTSRIIPCIDIVAYCLMLGEQCSMFFIAEKVFLILIFLYFFFLRGVLYKPVYLHA